nr:hypothetical protein Iba_chr12aCG1440 [Ipomoea batatas]
MRTKRIMKIKQTRLSQTRKNAKVERKMRALDLPGRKEGGKWRSGRKTREMGAKSGMVSCVLYKEDRGAVFESWKINEVLVVAPQICAAVRSCVLTSAVGSHFN